MRPIRLLILLLVLTAILGGLLVKALPGRAGVPATADSTGTTETASTTTTTTTTTTSAVSKKASRRHRRLLAVRRREQAIVRYARRFIGTPYTWGGSSPRTGFDCSGFVRYVYAHFGIELPHSSFSDLWRGRHVMRRSLRPGDIVFFDGNNHVGIYIGGNRIIHAPHTGAVVSITAMQGWYGQTYDAARRLLPN